MDLMIVFTHNDVKVQKTCDTGRVGEGHLKTVLLPCVDGTIG